MLSMLHYYRVQNDSHLAKQPGWEPLVSSHWSLMKAIWDFVTRPWRSPGWANQLHIGHVVRVVLMLKYFWLRWERTSSSLVATQEESHLVAKRCCHLQCFPKWNNFLGHSIWTRHIVSVSVISNLILFDTICQLNQSFSNCELEMLSNSIVKGSISEFHNPHLWFLGGSQLCRPSAY